MIPSRSEGYNNLEDMIKVGLISEIDLNNSLYRVVFEQDDDLKSNWFQPIFQNTYKDKAYCQYQLDEQVLCLMPFQGNQDGYILGAMYSDEDKPTRTAKGLNYIEYEDGSYVQYDKQNKRLTVNCPDSELILNCKKLIIQSDDMMTLSKTISYNAESYVINAKDIANNSESITNICDNLDSIVSDTISQNSIEQVIEYEDYGLVTNSFGVYSNTNAVIEATTAAEIKAPSSISLTTNNTAVSGNINTGGNIDSAGIISTQSEVRASGTIRTQGNLIASSNAEWSDGIKFVGHTHMAVDNGTWYQVGAAQNP